MESLLFFLMNIQNLGYDISILLAWPKRTKIPIAIGTKLVKLIFKNYGTFQSFILVLEKISFKGDIKLGISLRLFSESDFEIDYVPKEM